MRPFQSVSQTLRHCLCLCAALMLAGCSTIEVPLGPLFGDNKPKTAEKHEPLVSTVQTEAVSAEPLKAIGSAPIPNIDEEVTGSLPSLPGNVQFSEQDMNAALPNLQTALSGTASSALPAVWLNSQTGAFGSIIVPANGGEGKCKGFFISVAKTGGQDWLKGLACRAAISGKWEPTQLEPWQGAAPN